jgi:hypothetical protein
LNLSIVTFWNHNIADFCFSLFTLQISEFSFTPVIFFGITPIFFFCSVFYPCVEKKSAGVNTLGKKKITENN